jgi:transcriptional regulator with XRE-family HTH domain
MTDSRIGELRKARGWTQERLAQESGVTVRTIQRLEAGNDSSLDTLLQVATALDVPVQHLFAAADGPRIETAVDGLDVNDTDQRQQQQLQRRDSVRRSCGTLYYGVGTLLTIAVVAGFIADVLPTVGVLLIPAYWAAGYLISTFVLRALVDPWLDAKYLLSQRTASPSS